jgi:O-antigen/teichoic acid export membrane protein
MTPPATTPALPSLKSQVTSGAAWSSVGSVARQAVNLISFSILGRLLSVEVYGLMGMVNLFTNFLTLFTDLGLSYAIVRRDQVEREFLSSMFWLSGGTGLLAALVLFAVSWPAVLWFGEPELRALLQVMSLSFVVSSLGTVPMALMIRAFSFQRIAAIELTGGIVGALTSVTAAWYGMGVWSLVFGSSAGLALQTLLFWTFSPFRPLAVFRMDDVRSIFSFSSNLSGFTIINYFSRNADNWIIGSYLGKTELGYYSQAYNLMLFPLQMVTGVLGRVLYPAFSQMKDDLPRFQAAYVRVCAAIALLTFPMMLGLAVVARPLLHHWLGDKWDKAGLLLMILAPVGMLQSIGGTVGNIYTSKGRTDLLLRWGLFAAAVNLTAFLIGRYWGSIGVAIAYAIAALVLVYPNFAVPGKLIGLRIKTLAIALAPVLWMALAMATVVAGFLKLMPGRGIFELAGAIILGIAVYGALIVRFQPSGYLEVLPLLGSLIGKKR